MSATINSQRCVALDVLRGMTIAGMIIVNNPGSWSHVFAPLRHAPWVGCTPTDLVFPFFLFIVGAAMAFSFAKYPSGLNRKSLGKLCKRAALIFLVGLLLNAFPFYNTRPDPELSFGANYLAYLHRLRIFGVLQRIALAYLLGGFVALWLKKPGKIALGFAALLLVHWAILYFFGWGDDPYSMTTNISGPIDIAIVGESHVYKGYGLPFDPEGLLGVLSGAGTVLLGYLCGHLLHTDKEKIRSVGSLYTYGLVCLGVAIVWSNFLPICKALWTGSYVLYAGGWTIIMLAFFVYLIDVKHGEKWFFPFKALGLNPLFAFVMAGVFAKTLSRICRWHNAEGGITTASGWFYKNVCVALLGDNVWGSLLYALIYVLVFTLMAIVLYRKKIIIKL